MHLSVFLPSSRLVVCCGLSLAATQAGAAVFTVGGYPGCTHSTIQAAIDAAAANGAAEDEIRITVGGQPNQRLKVSGQSLLLSGGWSGCGDGATQDGRSTLIGYAVVNTNPFGSNTVLQISAPVGAVQTVTLRNLDIRDGNGSLVGKGGGIDAEGAVRVVLQDVGVFSNKSPAGNGGGIAMHGPASGFGGILELHADTRIHGNQASGKGGGVFLERATLRMRANRTGIDGNDAAQGGGIAATAGSSVYIGSVGEPEIELDASGAAIVGNAADIGGGVHLDGNALFEAYELRLSYNHASANGGGLYATGGAQVSIGRDYPSAFAVQCQGDGCSRIQGNQAGNGCPGTGGDGGGLYLDGARAFLSQVEILDNCAWGSPALEIWRSSLNMEGVLVARNRLRWRDGNNNTARQAVTFASRVGDPQTTASLAFATFADNVEAKPDGSTIPADAVSQIRNDDQWRFTVQAMASADPFPVSGVLETYGKCNRLFVPASDFLDAANGDYRPNPQGHLVDTCAAADLTYESRDPRLVTRCIDHPRPDLRGSCDIGAYELPPTVLSDRIFADGFD